MTRHDEARNDEDDPLVLGLDVGGTSVRCLVATTRGRRLGTGAAPGANPNAVGMPTALAHVGAAVTAALAGLDPARVAAAVMGAAGFAAHAHLGEDFARVWDATGLIVRPRLVGDGLVGFCAGTPARDGTIVLGGTGSGALEVRDLREGLVHDAAGWLLGDDGSGQWVGREAVRHAIRPGPSPRDPLAVAVRRALLGRDDGDRQDLVRAVYAASPLVLSTLAPVVVGLARDGDPDAVRVLVDAARLLERSVAAVRRAGDSTPVVLVGGLFSSEVLLAALTTRLQRTWPGAAVLRGGSGAGGAAWLAVQDLAAAGHEGHAGLVGPTLHAALTRLPLAVDGV